MRKTRLPPTRGQSGRRIILCIEDEPDMISLMKLILERVGFQVHGAVSGQQGLEVARQIKPDVVLLDLRLPDADGWEVARRIRSDEALRCVRIIIVSVVHPNGYADRQLLADDYVTKPFAPRELVLRVRNVLRSPVRSGQRERNGTRLTKGSHP